MHKISLLFILISLSLMTACGPEADAVPPLPTNTPVPTFTPTPEIVVTPVDPAAAATAQALEAQATAAAQQSAEGVQTGGEAAQAEAPTATPVPPTATPVAPSVVVDRNMNVRSGPGTNYSILGAANPGQRFSVTGKNPQGDWWQIDFNGQSAWLYGPLVSAENTGGVQVAANIPAPPPTPVPPTATPVPPTPVPAQPTQPPAPRYKFNVAVVGRCDPNAGVTYVQGKTYVGGTAQSGDWSVAFSYAPDGPIVAQVKAGPHPGYEGWDQGFYSHILKSDGPRQGTWWFWVVDPNGNRISELGGPVNTDGEAGAGKCQQAVVDFDSR